MKAGADARFTGPEGETALMIASRTGRVEVVRLLLARGADVNAKERWYGQTALMWAAAENHAAVVQALIDAGATIDARSDVLGPPKRDIADFRTDKNGLALQTLLTTFPKQGLTPLLFAARQGARRCGRASLADAGADLNLGDPDGITPMILAIRNGHYDVAAALVEKGANVNAADAAGRTPLYMSVDMHSLDWIQNRPTAQPSGTLDSLDVATAAARARARTPTPQLKAAPPGWKGDAVAAQNTFGGVLSAGSTPFLRAAKNADSTGDAPAAREGRRSEPRDAGHVTPLMALVGGLGRKYGADLQVSPEEEKNAMQAISAAARSRSRRQRRQRRGANRAARSRHGRRQRHRPVPGGSRRQAGRRRTARDGRRATRRSAAWPTSTARRTIRTSTRPRCSRS